MKEFSQTVRIERHRLTEDLVALTFVDAATASEATKPLVFVVHGLGSRKERHLDLCLRQCLASVYPKISDVRLTDYKVRELEPKKGTAAKVRVLVEWSDHRRSWATVGVSDNVIEASWRALVDAIRLELMRLTEQNENIEKVVEDFCWGV